MTRSCNSHGECQFNGCRQRHHSMLHQVDSQRRRSQQRGSGRRYKKGNQKSAVSRRTNNGVTPQSEEAPVERNLSCVVAEGSRLLFCILPVTLYGAGRRVNTYALQIFGLGKQVRHALRSVYSVPDLSLPMQTLNRRDVQCVHKDARLPVKPYSNVVPKLLVGLDHGHLGFPL